jgi:CRP/FNR family transcriptional regulator
MHPPGTHYSGYDYTVANLESEASVLQFRRRQRVRLAFNELDSFYLIRSGVLALHAIMRGKRRLLLGILYPGDVFQTSSAPPVGDVALMAATASDVLYLVSKSFEQFALAKPEIARSLNRRLAQQQARLAMHILALGALSGEERVAGLLIELALRLGTPVPGGTAFDVPLSRTDMADYLALNPDTLSRCMSRLGAKGVLERAGRSRMVIRSWRALGRECPIAEPLRALHGTERLNATHR